METANSASPTSPAVRFLGFLKQEPRERDPDPFEFEESDIVWSGPSSPPSDASASPPASGFSTSGSSSPGSRHPFRPDKLGLTAALSNDRRALVQIRKPSLDPTVSAATAARTIPPVAIPRSGSASDDLLCGTPAASGKYLQSAPVNVPQWPKHFSAKQSNFLEEEEDETEEEMLPPHEIVARSHNTSTFSVFEGVGRTLKGRDLRRVRNAVWQQTGFLD